MVSDTWRHHGSVPFPCLLRSGLQRGVIDLVVLPSSCAVFPSLGSTARAACCLEVGVCVCRTKHAPRGAAGQERCLLSRFSDAATCSFLLRVRLPNDGSSLTGLRDSEGPYRQRGGARLTTQSAARHLPVRDQMLLTPGAESQPRSPSALRLQIWKRRGVANSPLITTVRCVKGRVQPCTLKNTRALASLQGNCISAVPHLFNHLGSAFRPDTQNGLQITGEAGWLSTINMTVESPHLPWQENSTSSKTLFTTTLNRLKHYVLLLQDLGLYLAMQYPTK
ncbi:hypothetical protein NDU88_004982 [Pleurodeles waltl]|uniref:Uncharacterized protein n=1 Tax=Pleurodeles waltl TaxID=8319 RepID=A0AAV7W8C3_PLEWA|nr:hypothetical protein NDU88_004982 [Pleurodeles waltl]